MLKRRRRRFTLALMPAVMSCLSSCVQANYDSCPVYPVAGEKVAAELEKIGYDRAPNFWEWLGRIDKLRQELEVCGK